MPKKDLPRLFSHHHFTLPNPFPVVLITSRPNHITLFSSFFVSWGRLRSIYPQTCRMTSPVKEKKKKEKGKKKNPGSPDFVLHVKAAMSPCYQMPPPKTKGNYS